MHWRMLIRYDFLIKTIDDFSVYDRRMLANVLTTLAPYFDNDDRMRLLHQLRVSTISVSTYASERSGGSVRSSRGRSRTGSEERTSEVRFSSTLEAEGMPTIEETDHNHSNDLRAANKSSEVEPPVEIKNAEHFKQPVLSSEI